MSDADVNIDKRAWISHNSEDLRSLRPLACVISQRCVLFTVSVLHVLRKGYN